jgi:serine/threonine protein phosphatase PrpC
LLRLEIYLRGAYITICILQEAVAMVRPIEDPEQAAEKLLLEAFKRGSSDNITVVIVRFLDGTMGDGSGESKEKEEVKDKAEEKDEETTNDQNSCSCSGGCILRAVVSDA